MTRRSSLLAGVALAVATLGWPAFGSVGHKARPLVDTELALTSPAELGQPFRANGRAKFHCSGRRVVLSIAVPAGVELVEGGKTASARIEKDGRAEVTAMLRASRPAAGAELRLEVRFTEEGPGGAATEDRLVSRSLFVTIDEHEGGPGQPGELWTCYLPQAAPAPGGYVLRDYQSAGPFRGAAAAGLSRYTELLGMLRLGKAAEAAKGFEKLTVSNDSELSATAGNAAAVALATAGHARDAEASWTAVLRTPDLPDRVAAYVLYNRALTRWRAGDKDAARADLKSALQRHPGFTVARKALRAME